MDGARFSARCVLAVAVEVASAWRTYTNCVPSAGLARASVVTAGLSAGAAATGAVLVSGATDVSKSLISLFSPYLEPAIEFGSAGVPISPVSRMPAP